MVVRSPAFLPCAISTFWFTSMAAQIPDSTGWGAHSSCFGRGSRDDRLSEFDLGRSDCDNPGLIRFKDRWGATRSMLTYLRFPSRHPQTVSKAAQAPIVKYLFACVPDSLLAAAGRVLYKHIG